MDVYKNAKLIIASPSESDHAGWLRLWKEYQAFYKADISESATAQTWRRMLDPSEPVYGALAFLDGAIVAMVHWIAHRSCWTVGDYIYLQDLFVDPGLRGTGIGRQLIQHVYAQAAQLGAARVYWLTHESNTDAMHLYDSVAEKSGFIQYRKILA